MASNIDLEKPGLLADELKSRRVCCRRPLFRIFLLFVVCLLLGALIVSSMLQRVVNGNETVGFPLQSLKMGLWSEIAGNDAADVVQFDPVKRDVRLSDLEQLQVGKPAPSTKCRAVSVRLISLNICTEMNICAHASLSRPLLFSLHARTYAYKHMHSRTRT